jgi:hypothetical protein
MDTYLSRLWREGDRIMSAVAWAMFVLSLVLASFHDTWFLAFTVGLGLALASRRDGFFAAGATRYPHGERLGLHGICCAFHPADARDDRAPGEESLMLPQNCA